MLYYPFICLTVYQFFGEKRFKHFFPLFDEYQTNCAYLYLFQSAFKLWDQSGRMPWQRQVIFKMVKIEQN
ncbi:MAG: hypothetical protein EB059_04505 [Alphaproteobacteria bacterium]|nr:hypothetical protein [Alphaproteobacteria bacterium]